MTLVKFNNGNTLFPWNNGGLRNLLNYDPFITDVLLEEDSFLPAMNVKEHEKDFEIEFAAPGFSKKDFDVSIEGDMLHVSAEKSMENEEKDNGYTRREFSYNSFKRSIKLPENVNADKKVKAGYNDGILKLNLLKKEESKSIAKKKIEIL